MPDNSQEIQDRIAELLSKYYKKALTDDEWQELQQYCRQEPDLVPALDYFDNKKLVEKNLGYWDDSDTEPQLQDLLKKVRARSAYVKKRNKIVGVSSGLAATVLFLIMVIRPLVTLRRADSDKQLSKLQTSNTHHSSTSHFTLSLFNGQQLWLDDMGTDSIWENEGVSVKKTDNDKIEYITAATDGASVSGSNTIKTPVHGQFRIQLPDGTHVWLNNHTSLRFPAAFHGASRDVHLSGEAYFEVAKNTRMPFIVHFLNNNNSEQQVQVLGTSFNIKAYSDEETAKTTLVTGSIQVTKGNKLALLQPGQQLTSGENEVWQTTKVDVNKNIGWQKGIIHFEGDDLPEAMRELSRWYDIEPDIRAAASSNRFINKIAYTPEIEDVLKELSHNGEDFQYSFKGKKLIVTRK